MKFFRFRINASMPTQASANEKVSLILQEILAEGDTVRTLVKFLSHEPTKNVRYCATYLGLFL